MKEKMKYLFTVFMLLGFVAAETGYAAVAEQKQTSSNPVKETIEKTASIKEMRLKPARKLSYTRDILDNKIPTQTDNSGKL